MIPLIDLRAQYKAIGDDIEAAVIRVLRSGRYALGPEVEAFEREFAAFCETPHAVAVNSGTSALYVALRACSVGAGDEVITVPFTFVATVAAIRSTGALVRFVDIDPRSFTMDINAIERQITDRTKAIIPVHLFGQPVDMDPVLAVARQHGLTVIEDACQAHGATYKGRPVGSLGDLGCFSFYPSKNLGACGEGGMIVTKPPRSNKRLGCCGTGGRTDHDITCSKGGTTGSMPSRQPSSESSSTRSSLDGGTTRRCCSLRPAPRRLRAPHTRRDALCDARVPRVCRAVCRP